VCLGKTVSDTIMHALNKYSHTLTDTVGLCVAFARHAVSPQALVSEAAGQSVLHPVVRRRGDHQQDVADDSTEQTPSHEAVHPEEHWSCAERVNYTHTCSLCNLQNHQECTLSIFHAYTLKNAGLF